MVTDSTGGYVLCGCSVINIGVLIIRKCVSAVLIYNGAQKKILPLPLSSPVQVLVS